MDSNFIVLSCTVSFILLVSELITHRYKVLFCLYLNGFALGKALLLYVGEYGNPCDTIDVQLY